VVGWLAALMVIRLIAGSQGESVAGGSPLTRFIAENLVHLDLSTFFGASCTWHAEPQREPSRTGPFLLQLCGDGYRRLLSQVAPFMNLVGRLLFIE